MIMKLPVKEACEIIQEGRERSQRNDFWMMYCNIYPRMTEDNFVEFEEWYQSCKREAVSEQTTEEILVDVNSIINMTLGGQNGITV